jgi:Mg-chelatase subunit ChlD
VRDQASVSRSFALALLATLVAAGPVSGQTAIHSVIGDTLDIAAEAAGGRVESATTTDVQLPHGTRSLIDGNPLTNWESEPRSTLPQDIVLSFYQREPVLVATIVIEPPTALESHWAKDVEVWVSMDSSSAAFTKVAAASIPGGRVEHTIRFEPVDARFLKLRILTTQGSDYQVRTGDIHVLEGQRPGYTSLFTRHSELVRARAQVAPGEIDAAPWRPGATAPVRQFRDDEERIYVEVRSNLPEPQRVRASWTAVETEFLPPGTELEQWGSNSLEVDLAPGPQRGTFWIDSRALPVVLHAKHTYFFVGRYRVDLSLSLDAPPWKSIEFEVVPALPAAKLVGAGESVSGINIASAALEGRIESVGGEGDLKYWGASQLIDGVYFDVGDGTHCGNCGWKSPEEPGGGPPPVHEIVFSFHERREALVESVVVDASTWENIYPDPGQVTTIPRHVEVWVSSAGPSEGFTKVAEARLHPVFTSEQKITFPPTRARYVKLRLLNNFGGRQFMLSEVEIHESPEASPSIVADVPKNIASRALGGAIVRYTSTEGHQRLVELIDQLGAAPQRLSYGGRTEGRGWFSEDEKLPQEIVFAFRGDQVALVDRIVLSPPPVEGNAPTDWPKTFSVAVSQTSPLEGFEEVGTFTFAQEPREQAFPVNRRARFVRLRILENYGGKKTSLGEVQLIEGSTPGYRTILLGPKEAALTSRALAEGPPVDESGIAVEREKNDTPAEANRLELGRRTKGKIEPLGEEDHFAVEVPAPAGAAALAPAGAAAGAMAGAPGAPSGAAGPGPVQVVTVELLGRPHIRTSLALLDSTATPTHRYEPGRASAAETRFSWAVAPGDHVLRLSAPPVALVLIWDTSGSMSEENVKDLAEAVKSYISQVQPSERVNLIRFSGGGRESLGVEVLLPEFTSERSRLLAATEGKFFREGGTPLYDAIAKGIALLQGVEGNRAIILMTDGADTTSKLPPEEIWRILERERIRLYTIGLGEEMVMDNWPIGSSGERVLGHFALANGGRFFLARTSDELAGYYQEIASELRKPPTYYLRADVAQGRGRLAVTATGERIAAVSAPGKIELILDASGSMKRKLGGRTMMDAAKEAMAQIIQELPDDLEVALRFYGHRIREGQKGDCQDSELVFPFGKIDKPRLLALVRGVRALGTTPIAYSLQQVAGDLGGAAGAKMVVLVTDGKEECKGQPTAAVEELLAKGIDVRLNIVGFALADTTDKRQMREVAERTGGRFFDARDAKGLGEAIRQALAVPYEVLDASGVRVGGGVTGQGAVELPEGVYTVVVPAAGEPLRVEHVRIAAGGSTEVQLRKEGAEIGVQVVGP